MNPIYLLMMLPLFTLTIILKSIRWNCLLKIQDIMVPPSKVFRYYAGSIFWGIITPGRVGEAIKILYLTNNGLSAGRASVSVVLDRVFDLILLLLLTGLGVSIVFHVIHWYVIALCISVLCIMVSYGLRNKITALKGINRIFLIIPEKYRRTISQFVEEFKDDIVKFSFPKILLIALFSMVIWLVYAFPFFIMGGSMQLEASPVFLVTGVFSSAVVAMLPISIGGIGTREAFFVFYFNQISVPIEKSLLFSFMFIYMYVFALLFGMVVQPSKE